MADMAIGGDRQALERRAEQMEYPHRNADWTDLIGRLGEQIPKGSEVLVVGWSGASLAAGLQAQGFRVVVTDRRDLLLKAIADQPALKGHGVVVDDPSEPQRLITEARYGAILFHSTLENIHGPKLPQVLAEYTKLLDRSGVLMISQISGLEPKDDRPGFHPSGTYNNFHLMSDYVELLADAGMQKWYSTDLTASTNGAPCRIENQTFLKSK